MALPPAVKKALESQRFFLSAGGASEDEVSQLEMSLALTLPQHYREFLLAYGAVSWFGHCVLGIGAARDPDSFESDALAATDRARRRVVPMGHLAFPNSSLVIERYGGGGFFVLDCAKGNNFGKVHLLEDDDLGARSQSWPDFNSWLAWALHL